jgi:outer membrane protein OmpA-like peptidoglycan-associated protein
MSKHACKCKKSAECEECPEWIFTFADLVMLMMGFFVILWVLKPPAGKQGSSDTENVEAQRVWRQTVGEIRAGFGYEPNPNSKDPVDIQMIEKARGHKEGAETDRTRETAAGTDKTVQSLRPGSHESVGSRILFDAGAITLTPESSHLLDQIAEKIRGHGVIVLVKGHASLDDLPDGSKPEQRMDLSLRRAQATAEYLMSKGVAPEVLRVQGCSTFEPVKQQAYDATKQIDNRRVEVEWTSELLEDRQDRSTNRTATPNDATTKPGK